MTSRPSFFRRGSWMLLLCLCATGTSAEIVVDHTGATDPDTEGWEFRSSGTTIGGAGPGTEVTASGSHDYWNIQDLGTAGVSYYLRPSCLTAVEANWVLEASLRIVDSPVLPALGVGATGVIVDDGYTNWSFYIANGIADAIDPNINYAFSVPVDTQTDYVTYRIEFSANGPGHEDDTADFLIDGAIVADDVGRAGLFASNQSIVWMGPVSTIGTSDANYERVTIDYDIVPDVDGDGIPNATDNCVLAPNANQRDTNADGYGNICDADLDDDRSVNFGDLALFKSQFLDMGDLDADFNGDGMVNFGDLALFKSLFLGRPGPVCGLY